MEVTWGGAPDKRTWRFATASANAFSASTNIHRCARASVTQAKIANGIGGTSVPAAPTRMEMASVVTWVTNDATSNTVNRALNLVLPFAVTFISHLPPWPRHDTQENAYQSRGKHPFLKAESAD